MGVNSSTMRCTDLRLASRAIKRTLDQPPRIKNLPRFLATACATTAAPLARVSVINCSSAGAAITLAIPVRLMPNTSASASSRSVAPGLKPDAHQPRSLIAR